MNIKISIKMNYPSYEEYRAIVNTNIKRWDITRDIIGDKDQEFWQRYKNYIILTEEEYQIFLDSFVRKIPEEIYNVGFLKVRTNIYEDEDIHRYNKQEECIRYLYEQIPHIRVSGERTHEYAYNFEVIPLRGFYTDLGEKIVKKCKFTQRLDKWEEQMQGLGPKSAAKIN